MKTHSLVLSLLISVLAGCGQGREAAEAENASSPPSSPPSVAATRASGSSYSVRGSIMEINTARREISLHHESIPEMVGPDGSAEDMHAMVMNFSVADAVDLESLETGDTVGVVLKVDWKARPSTLITAISALPPDTELQLGQHSGRSTEDAAGSHPLSSRPKAAQPPERRDLGGGGYN